MISPMSNIHLAHSRHKKIFFELTYSAIEDLLYARHTRRFWDSTVNVTFWWREVNTETGWRVRDTILYRGRHFSATLRVSHKVTQLVSGGQDSNPGFLPRNSRFTADLSQNPDLGVHPFLLQSVCVSVFWSHSCTLLVPQAWFEHRYGLDYFLSYGIDKPFEQG